MHRSVRLVLATTAIGLSLSTGIATAGQLDLILNGRSYHMNADYDWNEQNTGLGVEYAFDSSSRWIWSVTANGFVDSQDNMSYMAGGALKRRLFQSEHPAGYYFDAGLVGFLMSRADIDDHHPFPGVLPMVSFGTRHIGINLTYLPQKAVRDFAQAKLRDPDIGGVLFFQFKFRLSGAPD